MDPLKTQAIQNALTGDWKQAIVTNQSILKENPDDIETLNRLAFAYASIGDSKEAKVLYYKVLELDKQNPIALRNLKRISSNTGQKNYTGFAIQHGPSLYIEEPGKTKVVELLNIADKKVLSPLRSGERLILQVKRMKLFVLDMDKQYIGMFPDDISKRLIDFIQGGNEYEAYIKTVDGNKVLIFIKEIKRATRFLHQASFVSTDKSKFSLETKSDTKHKKSQDTDEDGDEGSADDDDSE